MAMAIGAVTRSGTADLDVVRKRIGEVLQRVNRYWAGEAEVAATFFKGPRTKEEHLRWLKSQMVRELGWPDGRLTRVIEAYKKVEKEMDRHMVHDVLINASEWRLVAGSLAKYQERRRKREVSHDNTSGHPKDRRRYPLLPPG
jgi:hypothetical protein